MENLVEPTDFLSFLIFWFILGGFTYRMQSSETSKYSEYSACAVPINADWCSSVFSLDKIRLVRYEKFA